MVFFAHSPCLARSVLHTILTGNNDDGSICNAYGFFNLPHEIECSRHIQNVDLVIVPQNRLHKHLRCCRRFCHALLGCGCNTIHRGHQTGFACPTVPQNNHITNFVRCKNLHVTCPPRFVFSYCYCSKVDGILPLFFQNFLFFYRLYISWQIFVP